MSFRILEYSPSYDEGCAKRLLQGIRLNIKAVEI